MQEVRAFGNTIKTRLAFRIGVFIVQDAVAVGSQERDECAFRFVFRGVGTDAHDEVGVHVLVHGVGKAGLGGCGIFSIKRLNGIQVLPLCQGRPCRVLHLQFRGGRCQGLPLARFGHLIFGEAEHLVTAFGSGIRQGVFPV